MTIPTISPSKPLQCARLTALVLACAASLPALAFNPQPDPPGRWSLLGMVSEQTARLSVLALPVGRDAPPTSCSVSFDFLDGQGNKLAETTTAVLLPGQMQFVDLKGSELRLPNRSDRMQFRTEVNVLHNPPGYLQCRGAITSLELFDATGRSNLVAPMPSYLPSDPS